MTGGGGGGGVTGGGGGGTGGGGASDAGSDAGLDAGVDAGIDAGPALPAEIYAVSGTGTNVSRWPVGANGNVPPTAVLTGASTGFTYVMGITVDATGNVYVAAAAEGLAVFSPAPSGNQAPTRVIGGSNSLPSFAGFVGVAIDESQKIYVLRQRDVTNSSGSQAEILIFAPGATGNASPIQVISPSVLSTTMSPNIAVRNGKVFVLDSSLYVFSATANGNAQPERTINVAAGQQRNPRSVAIGDDGQCYVSFIHQIDPQTSESGVEVFAPNAQGSDAPTRTLVGAVTQLEVPGSMAVDPLGTLFVTSSSPNVGGVDAILTFAPGASGNIAPLRSVSGPTSGVSPSYRTGGLALH